MNNDFLIKNENKSDTLIVAFAGQDRKFIKNQRFEFQKFLDTHFKNVDTHFYYDSFYNLYHNGIRDISSNIDETVEYFKKVILPYKNVIFIGASSGGYAAILFGSLLHINSVLAFFPQTFRTAKNIDEKYRDTANYISNITKYYLYGELNIQCEQHCHHISHCERISHHPNVFLTKMYNIDLRRMRDNGELYEILKKLIDSFY